MFYQEDWIMRQIQMLVQFVARVFFHKDTIEYEIFDETNLTETDLLYHRLKNLISQKEFCEAEELLFESLNTSNEEHLKLAIDCYQTINQFNDNELESHNFSREEVYEGIELVLKRFGIQSLPPIPSEE